MARREDFVLGEERVSPGARATVLLPVPKLYLRYENVLPVHVVHGRSEGPVLGVTAAVHGDEITGVEIVRRLMAQKRIAKLRGTLVALPVVNVYGFAANTRYLPDRRDLNRSFPGSPHGSLAGTLAHLVTETILSRLDYLVDLHAGSNHRTNYPQSRGDFHDPETLALAKAFGAPVAIDSPLREGSLRGAAVARGVKTVVYEGGEALRFDEVAIRAGVHGISALMAHLGMLPKRKSRQVERLDPVLAHASRWVRSPVSGIFRAKVALGERVRKGMLLGRIHDPFSDSAEEVVSLGEGIVIGRLELPSVYKGDALLHIASFEKPSLAEAALEEFEETLADPASLVDPEDLEPGDFRAPEF